MLALSQLAQVSIHAPMKGATDTNKYKKALIERFNPRSHEGSDVDISEELALYNRFQSTLP